MEVTYETVEGYDASLMDIDVEEFEIITAAPSTPELAVEEDQLTMFSDMKIEQPQQVEQPEIPVVKQFTLNEEQINWGQVKAMEVIDEQEITSEPVLVSPKRYSLEDYMELEDRIESATHQQAAAKPQKELPQVEVAEEALVFEKKTLQNYESTTTPEQEVDPMENPIKDVLQNRVEERKRILKEFNHKFKNNPNRIDELEKEPAYKRYGIHLTDIQDDQQFSRTTLSNDANDEQQLRSNNSFLHDNVD